MIEFKGEVALNGSPLQIWQALNDPLVLKAALPGCEEIIAISDTEFRAVIAVKAGALNLKIRGRIFLDNLNPPISYSLRGEGDGGISGFIKGLAKVELVSDQQGGVVLQYVATALPGGKMASLGGRLLKGLGEKLAQDFFLALKIEIDNRLETL